MVLTLNQVISRLRSLALSHKQINYFYLGGAEEFDVNGDITFPACLVTLSTGAIDRANHQMRYTVVANLVDLVHVAERTEENELEVISDMTQVAAGLIALLSSPAYENDWMISDVTPVTPVDEALSDMVAGVQVEFSILVDHLNDACAEPADDVEFEQSFDMPRTKIYHYTGTGLEGNTIPIAALSGKHILAVWRADSYKRVIASTPADAGKIQAGTVDLGNGKGILGNGSFILETGDALIENEKLDILYYDA